MEEMILKFAPTLANYPFLLALTSVLFVLFFGGFIFSSLWGLLNGYRRY